MLNLVFLDVFLLLFSFPFLAFFYYSVDSSLLLRLPERDVSGGPVGGPVGMTPISFAGKIIYAHSTTTITALLDHPHIF
jgi:hypothetical protein